MPDDKRQKGVTCVQELTICGHNKNTLEAFPLCVDECGVSAVNDEHDLRCKSIRVKCAETREVEHKGSMP